MDKLSYTLLLDEQQKMFSSIESKADIDREKWYIFFQKKIKKFIEENVALIDNFEEQNPETKITKIIDILVNMLNKVNKEIYFSNSELVRFVKEIELDNVNDFLEKYTIYGEENKYFNAEESEFQYYPEYSDVNFNKKIYQKKEFNENKIPIMDLIKIQNARKKGRKKSPTQKFVKNFISQNTPYNGILLWHGVGVGKTCAAISIAENFKNFVHKNNKKILVLIPSGTLVGNWKDEIFSVSRELKKMEEGNLSGNVQCTGDIYLKEFMHFKNMTAKQIKSKANKFIKKYYEIIGYHSLANRIEKDFLKLSMHRRRLFEKAKIDYIRKHYSNRVIIMDEVHVTRISGENKNKKEKKACPYIEMIMRYAENTKVILCTATPMYNVSSEIVWLLNLLLWNDKQAPLEDFLLFDNPKEGILLRKYDDDKEGELGYALKRIKDKSRGYISYLRGENPFIYPYKLYPSRDIGGYVPNPKYILKKGEWIEIDEEFLIPNDNRIIFFKNQLSNWQFTQLENISKKAPVGSKIVDGFGTKSIQASNIVYPSGEFDGDSEIGLIGAESINNSFIISNNKYTLRHHAENNHNGKSFLHIDNIGKYSKKIENILHSILTSKGIVFVYSNYGTHGIKPLALALEENGFNRYVGNEKSNNFLNKKIADDDKYCAVNKMYKRDLKTDPDKLKNFRQAKYIYLDGFTKKNELSDLVREIRGEGISKDGNFLQNDFGEHILVILGSKVIEQGVSLHNVREIHIMDPWWHLNMLEQAAGRGFRNYSHFNLDKKFRNLTLYLHIGALPKGNKSNQETNDEKMYRVAYYKKQQMSIVERLLKQNAVDCGLNKFGNIFLTENYSHYPENPLENQLIIDSKGDEYIVNLSDVNNSLKCDFNDCNYKCDWENESLGDIEINSDTFSEDFAVDDIEYSKEVIKSLFYNEYVYSEEQIIDIIINQQEQDINIEYIYIALNDVVNNKELVSDLYGRAGYIISRNGFYIFQPSDLNDENIPLRIRIRPLKNKIKSINIKENYIEKKPQIKKLKTKFKKKKHKTEPAKPKITTKNHYDLILNVINNNYIINKKSREKLPIGVNEYIRLYYSDYPEDDSERKNISEPTQNELILAKKFEILDKLLTHEKINVISKALSNIIENNGIPTNELDDLILNFFDKKNDLDDGYSIFREKRDYYKINNEILDETLNDPILDKDLPKYFRVIDATGTQQFFEYKTDGQFIDATSLVKPDNLKLDNQDYNFDINSVKVFGYIKLHKGKPNFYVINKINYKAKKNQDGSDQEKSKRRGAVCGHAKGVKEKHEIASTINYVLGFDKYNPNGKLPHKNKTINRPYRSLCEELELILRTKELRKTNNDRYWFYSMEQYNINL